MAAYEDSLPKLETGLDANQVKATENENTQLLQQDNAAVYGGVNVKEPLKAEPSAFKIKGLTANGYSNGNGEFGTPIADQFGWVEYDDRVILALADGCSLGPSASKAAKFAVRESMVLLNNYMLERELSLKGEDLHSVFSDIMHETHKKMSDSANGVGSTTLLLGVLFIKSEKDAPQFVFASVGDCKAYVRQGDGSVRDLTAVFPVVRTKATDPGGRLGDVSKDPDMRNFAVSRAVLRLDDTLLLCTDGVYDNLDPEYLGLSPDDALIKIKEHGHNEPNPNSWGHWFNDFFQPKTWNELRMNRMEYFAWLKSEYARAIMEECLQGDSIHQLSYDLMKHVLGATVASREWLSDPNNGRIPEDYVKFPGKLDHTTMLACQFTQDKK